MKIIKPSVEILNQLDGQQILKSIEIAGRTCYKSEDKITEDSSHKFVSMLLKRKHEAMIEHGGMITMRFICDRGVTHEIVRHRLFSFAQESTRYVNYGGKDMKFIKPCWIKQLPQFVMGKPFFEEGTKISPCAIKWVETMSLLENQYNHLISEGWTPQEARSILPNSLKTEIIISGNPREWRNFFSLRTPKEAHPQMREVAGMALKILTKEIPLLFDEYLENMEV